MARIMHKDKEALIQIFGCLLKQPMLLLDDRFAFIKEDFPEKFYQAIFGAIEYLVKNGAPELDAMAINNYLSGYPSAHKAFEKNNGLEFITKCAELAEPSNFEYYYNKVKKLSLLNQLEEKGFPTVDIYDPSICGSDDYAKMQAKFDNYTLDDIFNIFDGEIIELKDVYSTTAASTGCQAAKGMVELKEQYKQMPEMGMAMCSPKLTTIFRGRRLKKVYLKTAPSGFGKTRISSGDACCVSIPTIYDSRQKAWVTTNQQEPSLIISTELDIDEIQTMIIAYVSDVPEEKILDGKYEGDEEERVDKAIEIISQSPLYIEHVPNFNIDDIERVIKRYKVKHNIGYIFFDYIFTSVKILSEIATKTKGVKLREDNVLIMFIDRMKTLANILNIHIDTSSQANGDWKNAKDADQNLIRGAKGMADKIDAGYVILPPSEKDKEAIKSIQQHGFYKEPNLVFHIYKVRRGKINHVKLWVYFDYSTCRTYDIFATDRDNKLINIENTSIEVLLEQTLSEPGETSGSGDDVPWY